MEVLTIASIVLIGAALGSFACVVIDRLPVELDEPNEFGETWDVRGWSEVVGGRSRCSSCEAPVTPLMNVPVLSWLVLRGRCRSCGARIPAFHPLVELAVPLAAVGIYLAVGWSWYLLPALVLVVPAVTVAVIDLRTLIIPTKVVWPTFGVVVAASVVAALAMGRPGDLVAAAIGAATLTAPFYGAYKLHPAGMGFGDVRLGILLGWSIGFAASPWGWATAAFAAVVCMVLASVVGIIFGLALAGLHRPIPFGPSLVTAALFCVAVAEEIAQILGR